MTHALSPQLHRQILATRLEYRAREQTTLVCDRVGTELIISRIYARLKRSPPRFVWLDGPLSCVLAINAAARSGGGTLAVPGKSMQHAITSLRDQLRLRLAAATQQQLDPAVCDALGTKHWIGLERYEQTHEAEYPEIDLAVAEMTEGLTIRPEGTRCAFDSTIGGQIFAQLAVGDHDVSRMLQGRVASTLGLPDAPMVRLSSRMHAQTAIWGAENQCWVGHHVACQLAGVNFEPGDAEFLAEWDALSRMSGWWFPHENVVFCAERPARLGQDPFGQLHHERGPALEFRDGWKVYCWHGLKVPAEWIEHPENLNPRTALWLSDMRQRFAAAAIVGWARVIEHLTCRVIDTDRDPSIGTLLECDLPDFGQARFLRVRCATGREFVLSVSRFVQTARQANAWTYGLIESDYQLEART